MVSHRTPTLQEIKARHRFTAVHSQSVQVANLDLSYFWRFFFQYDLMMDIPGSSVKISWIAFSSHLGIVADSGSLQDHLGGLATLRAGGDDEQGITCVEKA